jgi:hypothetical protein
MSYKLPPSLGPILISISIMQRQSVGLNWKMKRDLVEGETPIFILFEKKDEG